MALERTSVTLSLLCMYNEQSKKSIVYIQDEGQVGAQCLASTDWIFDMRVEVVELHVLLYLQQGGLPCLMLAWILTLFEASQ